MSISNFPNGFPGGITIRGMPVTALHPGEIFWVNNSSVLADGGITGSNGNPGTYQKPFGSIDYAIGQCTANRGDIIVVMPGYTETISAATNIIMDVAGIAIVGCGTGSLRPTLTFSATGSNILYSGANSSVYNILHLSTVTDCVSAYTATGTPTDMTFDHCEFRDTSGTLGFINSVTGVATANATDGLHFTNNHIYNQDETALTTAIELLGVSNHCKLNDNWICQGASTGAALVSGSTFNHLDLEVARNRVYSTQTAATVALLSSSSTACTGHVYDNYVQHFDTTGTNGLMAPTGTKLAFDRNYSSINYVIDKSQPLNPAAV